MKKLFVLAFATMLCVACSTEENTTLDEGSNLEVVLENYKGVFTTLDGQTRGTLDVELSEDNRYATGNLTLSTGEVISIFTDQITDLGNRKEISFNSNDLSFTMTTGEEEEIMEVDAVTFRGAESSILVGQSTERAPLSPVVGAYTCTMCPAPLDNTASETFNLLIPSTGNTAITTQTTLGGTTYNGVGTQSGCVVNGSQTTCNLNSGTVAGITGTAFNPGGGPVTWSGTHTFDNGATGPSDCSTVSGTWSWASNTIGTVGGAFTSASSGDCAPPLTQLRFEDFEDNTLTFSVEQGSLFHDGGNDYVHIVPLNGPAEADIASIGNNHFGVEDMDDGNSRPRTIELRWEDIPVSSFSNITVAANFAESNADGSERWDANSAVFVQYSFNNTGWTTILSIQSTINGDNSAPRIDTDGSGNGDGTEITNVFQEFAPEFATGGNPTVSIRILVENLDLTNEDVAIDNVTISGN
ncbi:hypothetical protein [Dokdonia sp.]|uniref:hypothetical protein n=1 Tax=Dokdonia sp. TaxID=2024995 RepID=UPI003267DBB6